MAIIRWHQRNPLADIVSNFFDNDYADFFGKRACDPSANIIEKQEGFELEIAAPGLSKDDFKINLENSVLTISSEMEDEKREEGKNYTRKEFYYGSFSRSFTLPKSVDIEKIKADYKEGILRIDLPKRAEAKLEAKKEIRIS
ncbi:MAG: Hsp20/alpha crystallin family protein [Bacteroidetes bacterium]|nr:MAG: Hsp20/alpha crystallin family protein [Bacteroidota bacterium]